MSVQDKNIIRNAGINPAKIAGGLGGQPSRSNAKNLYVDGTYGSDAASGTSPGRAKKTVQAAIDVASAFSTIYVYAKDMTAGATDPASYEENLIIPATEEGLAIIGVSRGRTQGGLPQFKDGSGTTTSILIIRSPGCYIANIGFNGAGNTGGGILLDDDSSTKTAFGTTIFNCHFKNSKSSGNASTGGAIAWSANGGAWQVLIDSCHFYNCRAGIVLIGTGQSRPQDVVIKNCSFLASANTTVDCDIYLAGGSGVDGLLIDGCQFAVVDVPAYASSPAAARYLDLTGCTEGMVSNCAFACISQGTSAKTWGSSGDAALIPTTVRISRCHGEPASDATGDSGDVYRT